MSVEIDPSSFRDPSGFVFRRAGSLHRQVNACYREDYELLRESGLYAELVGAGLLIPHVESDEPPALPELAYRVITPERIPFISYPYEWCYGQLQDAALATLDIQRRALARGMTLKDASAYNIQFHRGRPLLVDTLSFTRYREGQVWDAYRQFCQQFLAPLALMALVDVRLGLLLREHIDGIPLDLAAALLPARSWLRPGLATHLHLHARAQARHADTTRPAPEPDAGRSFGRTAMEGLIDSLHGTVAGLEWAPPRAGWSAYYYESSYSAEARAAKEAAVRAWVERVPPATVWDLGANTGRYSRIAAEGGAYTVAMDSDAACVQALYRAGEGRGRLLPLVMDLTNPSPALGWAHAERLALQARGPADLVLALALVHHLAISNNLPLARLADTLAGLAPRLVIEFVPKEDPQVQRLLGLRRDIFADYTGEGFERAFAGHFRTVERRPLPGTGRVLYLLEAIAR